MREPGELIPTGPLQPLPWAVLPACAGRPVTVSPSAALLVAAKSSSRPANGQVTVAAGPGLPGSRAEATSVAEIYSVRPLLDAAASVDEVTKALDGNEIAHLATHGILRADNPLFSSLRFADGPLMAYDLKAVPRPPDTVVLAACDTGCPVVQPGDEIMGFAATLLAHGTRRLIAPVIAIHDIDTAPLMIAFHRLLKAEHSAAAALALAQQQTADAHSAGVASVARFICLGT